jgi:ShK domain-like/VHL beta domain
MKWYSKYSGELLAGDCAWFFLSLICCPYYYTSPYPFAAMSEQGIWWEDLLQTTTVRFHRSNDLTEFFGIPNGDNLDAPVFIFGKRGQDFKHSTEGWARISTNSREEFEAWVWQCINVKVIFVNNHDHPVEIFWIHGRRANVKMILQPGDVDEHTTMLSHEWWVRDARTDSHPDSPGRWKLTNNNMLVTWKITSDEENQRLVIPLSKCFDLSGHCDWWRQHGECTKNPKFMEEQCAKTCALCAEVDNPSDDTTEGGRGHDEF